MNLVNPFLAVQPFLAVHPKHILLHPRVHRAHRLKSVGINFGS